MFEDHMIDLFGLEIEDWIDENDIIAEFVSWSEILVLPDNHPDHSDSLERYFDDEETAVNFLISQENLMITLNSAKIVEKSDDFPAHLFEQLNAMATVELYNHNFLSMHQRKQYE